ncbi:unnamed protein product [Dovyalis caffra]|uniref:Uncharacterized protein n=1 Tax=Dovyalis caffra TaxID=77055 RepID=A0AAV1SEJ9_9ROSI|nr:unnamed protein product [Dovyalis caffra]
MAIFYPFSSSQQPAAPLIASILDFMTQLIITIRTAIPVDVNPGSETRLQRRNSGEFWPNSDSDRFDDRKLSDFDLKNDLGFVESGRIDVGFEEIGEIEAKERKFESLDGEVSNFKGKGELGFEENVKAQMGFEGFGETQSKDNKFVKFWSDSSIHTTRGILRKENIS